MPLPQPTTITHTWGPQRLELDAHQPMPGGLAWWTLYQIHHHQDDGSTREQIATGTAYDIDGAVVAGLEAAARRLREMER